MKLPFRVRDRPVQSNFDAVEAELNHKIDAPKPKPAITGSRGGNVALENLLTALAAAGLIVDSTTA